MDDAPPGYVTTTVAATLLGYTLQHTRLLIRTGKLRAQKFGRDWLVEQAAVEELAKHKAHRNEKS
jgi:excisionase family DNA binding protein